MEVVVSCETGGHNDGLMETLKYIMQSQLYPIMYFVVCTCVRQGKNSCDVSKRLLREFCVESKYTASFIVETPKSKVYSGL